MLRITIIVIIALFAFASASELTPRTWNGLVEVARGKRSWLSSQYAHLAAYKCFDDDFATMCHTHRGYNQYVAVDLGQLLPVKLVQIWPTKHGYYRRLNHITVYAGESTNYHLNSVCKGPSNMFRYSMFQYTCPEVPTRYVHVVSTALTWLHFGNIRVWATDVNDRVARTDSAILKTERSEMKSVIRSSLRDLRNMVNVQKRLDRDMRR